MAGLAPKTGLSFSPSLWRVVNGLWSGAAGFLTGWNPAPTGPAYLTLEDGSGILLLEDGSRLLLQSSS